MSFLKENIILVVVFITGAVVLAVEVMAVRILSPYFGNTIFSFSSVISVILAALSVGYWRGGRMADKDPSQIAFYRLVTLSGLSVLFLQFISTFVLPVFSFLSLTFGPLVVSIILFFYPSYLFGLLSPYAIKLHSMDDTNRGVGSVSGEVFFSSTLGSIFGSLSSGFFLIPYIGVHTSMIVMGAFVSLIGLIGLVKLHDKKRKIQIFGFFVFLGVFLNYGLPSATDNLISFLGDVVYAEDGTYEYISVVDREYNGTYGRILFLDRSASSGITLPDGKLLFEYAFFNNLYGFFNEKLNNALVLGAGTGSLAKDISEKYPEATVDIVDIEPKLFYLSHKYFQVPTSSKIVEHVGDGRQFLRRSDMKYDFIFGDMYSSLYSAPWHVMTKEYYESVWDHLNDNGVYMGNYIAAIDLKSPLLDATIQTLSEVFEEIYIFAVTSPDISTPQNIIIVAIKNNTTGKHITADELEKSDNDIIRGFADKFILDKLTSSKNRVLTDDLAPVELYSAKLIGSINTAE